MRFRSETLGLALAAAAAVPTHTASAFAPSHHLGGPSGPPGAVALGAEDRRALAPRDLIASNMRTEKAFVVTNTLRWEMRSTLTRGDEGTAAATGADGQADGADGQGGAGDDKPPFPTRRPDGIYEIENADQHNAWLQANPDKLMVSEAAPCRTRSLAVALEGEQASEIDEVISDGRKEENLLYLRTGVPFFKDFDDDDFYELMDKAKLVTFEQGDVIMRQGMEGSMFYVIESGEVEIMVKTAFEDPLTTPPDYLGAVINVLGPHNYFGERALITKEPRAASIRALQKTRCFAFDVADIPNSSVLSGKKEASTERMAELNSKYGTDVYDIDLISDQFATANVANQQRGSVNTPEAIRGVDVDEDYVPPGPEDAGGYFAVDSNNERVISLLLRFKQVRRAAKCFEYILKSRPNFGDVGEARRRALLVSKLTRAQREEFAELFRIIDGAGDGSRDGRISILDLRRAMESVGEARTDEELRAMINNADPNIDGNEEINFAEFMGVMAEAEFYYLFLDTFEMLDVNNTGFVSAGDLDRVLCGVRDLISDDRMSIIDTEDMDMQVDYETYADMLLGKPL
ncbi:hypothetical protein ACHAWF_012703 [Thalassiosira exigua]